MGSTLQGHVSMMVKTCKTSKVFLDGQTYDIPKTNSTKRNIKLHTLLIHYYAIFENGNIE